MTQNIGFSRDGSIDSAANYLAARINLLIAQRRSVCWFLSGGSAINVATLSARQIDPSPNVTIILVDERYGPTQHPDSNWAQLLDSGFEIEQARLKPVITGKNLSQTVADYKSLIEEMLTNDDYKIGLLGIGPDGHTAGILPNSPAAKSLDLVSSYAASDFDRITMTPGALAQLDEAVVFAHGEAKWPQLERLDQNLSVNIQPAQILKKIKKVIIFSDYKGVKK